jgi:ComF family protein
MFQSCLAGLFDLLAPPECAGCALPTEVNGFCQACAPLIEPAPLQPPARSAAAVCYQGPIADAIRRFKYAGRSDLVASLAPLLVESALQYSAHIDAVVPMPLHSSRLRERGWNPSALLAKPVARALGVPMRTDWLRRKRATQPQAGLPARARVENVRGAFEARTQRAGRVLLIDDVRTTGATLSEAARCLTQAGLDVISLALAWAPMHDFGEPPAKTNA